MPALPKKGQRLIIEISNITEHDVVIIGGGVAGYVAAIKAGQEGLKVSLILCEFALRIPPLC